MVFLQTVVQAITVTWPGDRQRTGENESEKLASSEFINP